jgi:hypothetical protein
MFMFAVIQIVVIFSLYNALTGACTIYRGSFLRREYMFMFAISPFAML